MRYTVWQPKAPDKAVPVWEQKQQRILKEDRDGDPVFVRAIQAMQVSPGKVRTA